MNDKLARKEIAVAKKECVFEHLQKKLKSPSE